MKCDNCIHQKLYVFGSEEGRDYEFFKCGHPDEDIAEVNNDSISAGKAIISCSEYKTRNQVRDEHCKEEALLAKAEEFRQQDTPTIGRNRSEMPIQPTETTKMGVTTHPDPDFARERHKEDELIAKADD